MTNTFMTDRNRVEHAHEVIASPLFIAVRPGSGKVAAWAHKDHPEDYLVLGYRPVRGTDIEELPAGSYTPKDKDFGVFALLDKKSSDPHRVGHHILMAADRAMVEKRKAMELNQALNRNPKAVDRALEEKLEETESTLNKEIPIP